MEIININVLKRDGKDVNAVMALDIESISTPIESVGGVITIFTKEAPGINQTKYTTSDSLAALDTLSNKLLVLTAVERENRAIAKTLVFVSSRIVGSLKTIAAVGTEFYYKEEGVPHLVQYRVSESITDITAATVQPGSEEDVVTKTTTQTISGAKSFSNAAGIATSKIIERTVDSGVDVDGVLLKDSQVTTDVINEKTAAAGVTLDGVLLKDSQVTTDVINEKTAATGVTIDGVLLKDSQVTTDTINEKTAATGVTIDGVLLKDNIVTASRSITENGTAALPAVKVGTEESGLYRVSATQTGVSVAGSLQAVFDTSGEIASSGFKNRVNRGTTPVGTVSIKEYGDGKDITVELTLTDFIIGALAGAAANLGIGNIVYAFPAGQHFELVSSFSALILTAAGTAVATDTGLGSVVASGAVAVLSGTATFEDRLTGQTINTAPTGGASVSVLAAATAGIGTGISLNIASSVKNVFLNSAGLWNVNNTGNLTASGKILLKYTALS